MGIQELEKSQTVLTKLSAADLEDLVGKYMSKMRASLPGSLCSKK